MLAVKPTGDNGGNEKLRAVADELNVSDVYLVSMTGDCNLRIRPSVSHGEEEGFVVGELEVFVGKLLAVDGLAARALSRGVNQRRLLNGYDSQR